MTLNDIVLHSQMSAFFSHPQGSSPAAVGQTQRPQPKTPQSGTA